MWVSWVTGLLAGTARCEWAAWYKAHFQHAKRVRETDFDMDRWERQHQELVDAHVQELLGGPDPWPTVTVETMNKFQLKGQAAILAGKPDIVAVQGSRAPNERGAGLVIDEKGGSPKPEHVWQVKLYLYALERLPAWKHLALTGQLAYRGVRKDVTLAPGDDVRIGLVMRMVAAADPPKHTPSADECDTCDIDSCPARIAAVLHTANVTDF